MLDRVGWSKRSCVVDSQEFRYSFLLANIFLFVKLSNTLFSRQCSFVVLGVFLIKTELSANREEFPIYVAFGSRCTLWS